MNALLKGKGRNSKAVQSKVNIFLLKGENRCNKPILKDLLLYFLFLGHQKGCNILALHLKARRQRNRNGISRQSLGHITADDYYNYAIKTSLLLILLSYTTVQATPLLLPIKDHFPGTKSTLHQYQNIYLYGIKRGVDKCMEACCINGY